MRLLRRAAIAAACLVPFGAVPGLAQDYPTKSINLIVPSSPGSAPDVIGRVLSDSLSRVLGQPVVADNRAGAGGTLGAAIAADAPADGYTLLLVNVNQPAGEELYPDLGYDLLGDFIPVTRIASSFYVFVVPATTEVKTLAEMIDLIKEKPGQLNYASAGVGAGTFTVAELFKASAGGLDLIHIPYNGGGPALASIVAGETDLYGSPYSTAKPFIDDGKLRPLAVSSAERSPYLPDVPAVSETLPGFAFPDWYGIVVPEGTPQEIVEKLHAAVSQSLADEEVVKRLDAVGFVPVHETPQEFGDFLKSEVEKSGKLIRENNLRPN